MSGRKPNIGLVSSHTSEKETPDLRMNQVNECYIKAIRDQGGIPFMIPLEYPLDEIERIFELFAGLVLVGGGDVAIERYGGAAHERVSKPILERDELEIQIVREAARRDVPLLGICRGMQVMNVALGGTLYSDLPDQRPSEIRHNSADDAPMDVTTHSVLLHPKTKLLQIYEVDQLEVNSFHHQGVKDLADSFIPAAHSKDGLTEAFESPNHQFVVGVQWHPEALQKTPVHTRIFNAFIHSCNAGSL